MFPILKRHIYGSLLEESETFTTEVPLPFDEEHSAIFFSKRNNNTGIENYNALYFYDKEGTLLLEDNSGKSVEQSILELLANGEKVTYLVRVKKHLLQLYVTPKGCDSVAEIMIPMLANERQKAKDALQKKMARLYPKKEEQKEITDSDGKHCASWMRMS